MLIVANCGEEAFRSATTSSAVELVEHSSYWSGLTDAALTNAALTNAALDAGGAVEGVKFIQECTPEKMENWKAPVVTIVQRFRSIMAVKGVAKLRSGGEGAVYR